MSFVTQEDVFAAVEPVLRGVFEEFGGGKPVTPKFPLIAYADAMLKYGTDKPDLRNPLVIADVTRGVQRPERHLQRIQERDQGGRSGAGDPGARRRRAAALVLRQARRLGAAGHGRGRASATSSSRPTAAKGRSPSSFRPTYRRGSPAKAGIKRPATRCSSRPASRPTAAKLAGAARTKIGDELGLVRQGPVRVLLDRRLSDVRMERGGEEDRFLPQSVLDAELSDRRISRSSIPPTATRSSPSRRSSTTSSATAWNCPPARSAITVRT